jgi:hypothetical protein
MYLISCGPPIPETSARHFIQAQIYGVWRRIESSRNCRTEEGTEGSDHDRKKS